MNKGLKRYTKQLKQRVGKASIYVNINKDDANLHIHIPLIKTVGLYQFETSLIFNLQDVGKIGLFGKGFKLNSFKEISEIDSNIIVKNADGSTDEYHSDCNFHNEETQQTVKKVEDDSYGIFHYEIIDKYGNSSRFEETQNYPAQTICKNGAIYESSFIPVKKWMHNNVGDHVWFSKNGNENITKIEYTHDYNEITSVDIDYDSNGYISLIEFGSQSALISTLSLSINENKVEIIDTLSGYRIKYSISNGKVVSFIDGYYNSYGYGKETRIDYFEGYTKLTNYMNEKTYCFFDQKGLPSYDIDEDGNIQSFEYDTPTKTISFENTPFNPNYLNNLLGSDGLLNFDNDGVEITEVIQDNPIFSKVIGDFMYGVKGPGILKKQIKTKGLSTDNLFLCIFGKQLTKTTDKSYCEINLSTGMGDSSTKTFLKSNDSNLIDLKILALNAGVSYADISITITLVGDVEIELSNPILAKKEFGYLYSYDESSNLTGVLNGSVSENMSYNQENFPSSSIGEDSSSSSYKHDEKGNLAALSSSYGVQTYNEYDSKYKCNLISSTTVNKENNRAIETKYTYTDDGRFLSSLTDELGNKTIYKGYDPFGRILKLEDALGNLDIKEYNSDKTLRAVMRQSDALSNKLIYSYDEKRRITEIETTNGSKYDFNYDDRNNISKIKLNGLTIFVYEYDPLSGNIIRQGFDDRGGSSFYFSYNEKGLVSEVYYGTSSSKSLRFKYIYDSLWRLTSIQDSSGKVIDSYSYDQDGRIIKKESNGVSISNVYDGLNNVIFKTEKNGAGIICCSFDSASRSKGSHPSTIYSAFNKTNSYIGLFEDDASLKCGLKDDVIKPSEYNGASQTLELGRDGIIPYVSINPYKRLRYQITSRSKYNDPAGFVGFWFKSDLEPNSFKRYLFSSLATKDSRPDRITVYLQNKKVYLEVVDYEGNTYTLIESDTEVDFGSWNFLSLNFINRYDGQGYSDICEYCLTLNSHRQSYKKEDPRLYVDWGSKPIIDFGFKDNGTYASNEFIGKIAALMIGRNDYLSNKEVTRYYRLTKDYIIDNSLVDEEMTTVDFGQTSVILDDKSIYDMFDIYPLQNNVVSLKEKTPSVFNIRKTSEYDKDRTFNFNSKAKGYSYVADGEELVYYLGFSTDGCIAAKVYTDTYEAKQILFELKSADNRIISLYRDENKKLAVSLDGNVITSALTLNNNEWHDISLSYKESFNSGYDIEGQLDIRIRMDNTSCYAHSTIKSHYSNMELMVGRSFSSECIDSNLGGYRSSCPFYGQIEMLCTRAAYCESETLTKLFNSTKNISKTNEYDDFGMLRKTDLHYFGDSFASYVYSYKARNDDLRYISKTIDKERIASKTFRIERSYEIDACGNVIKVTDNLFGSHDYEYDYRGYLVRADDTLFQYDGNGNLIKKGNSILKYDRDIKDRLMAYDGNEIYYDSANGLNPTKYGIYSYQYEGKRLTRFTANSGYYDYTYDAKGLRIKKKDWQGRETTYSYDGDKLIRQKSYDGVLNFLYDENEQLYGFIKDSVSKYFYIRDSLSNILGIIDGQGSLVVKYSYDPWGKIQSIEDNSSIDLGRLNPFKYKGYYYDIESGMYYCKSRYYVPEWGRWLNTDNPDYLSLGEINGCNLFAYCGNNPITYFDGGGRFSFLACLALGGVGALISMSASAIMASMKGEEITWQSIAIAGIGGFFSGFIGAAFSFTSHVVLGAYASAFGSSFAEEMASYFFGIKGISTTNIMGSIGEIALDTLIYGTLGAEIDSVYDEIVKEIMANAGASGIASKITQSYLKGAINTSLDVLNNSLILIIKKIVKERYYFRSTLAEPKKDFS